MSKWWRYAHDLASKKCAFYRLRLWMEIRRAFYHATGVVWGCGYRRYDKSEAESQTEHWAIQSLQLSSNFDYRFWYQWRPWRSELEFDSLWLLQKDQQSNWSAERIWFLLQKQAAEWSWQSDWVALRKVPLQGRTAIWLGKKTFKESVASLCSTWCMVHDRSLLKPSKTEGPRP